MSTQPDWRSLRESCPEKIIMFQNLRPFAVLGSERRVMFDCWNRCQWDPLGGANPVIEKTFETVATFGPDGWTIIGPPLPDGYKYYRAEDGGLAFPKTLEATA